MAESVRVTVEELRLRNFRAFENARLPLSDLTYLVGRNGAGKSSLLDAFALLQEAVTDSLENALDRRGGLSNVRRLAAQDKDKHPPLGIALVMSIPVPGRPPIRAVYGFELLGHETEPVYVSEERLDTAPTPSGFVRRDRDPERPSFESPGRKLDPSPPAGNLVFPLIGRSDSLWERVLEAVRGLRTYEISPAHMVVAPEIGERTALLPNGSNAGDVIKALKSGADHEWLLERLSLITEGLTEVRAEAVLGRRVLRFVQNQGDRLRELDANSVSQGTLRGLGVLLALRQRPTPSVVLIDEIENSLHPGALGVLLDAAAASCDRTRVVLTTHSPEVLSHPSVTGERVRVVDWRDGTSGVLRLSSETRAAINAIDTVGWMLRTNALWTGPEPETFGDDLFALGDAEA